MVALDLVVGVLAVQYIVYVMVQSDLLVPLRRVLWSVPTAGQFLGKIFSCFHCASFWAALFVVSLWWFGDWPWLFVWVCALAGGGQRLYAEIDRLAERKAP